MVADRELWLENVKSVLDEDQKCTDFPVGALL
jgi:hypothetical protein